MLPKFQRLNLKKDFKWVAGGKRVDTKNFQLRIRTGENTHPLVGIAVSSKAFKKANLRNRARRLSSKAIETIFSSLQSNLNLVIMPKVGVLNQSPEQLIKEIQELISKTT